MTLLPFVAFTFGAGLGAWFGRFRPRVAAAVGLTGLTGALILAVGLPNQGDTVVGGEPISGGPYLRLFVAAACVAGIGLSVLLMAAVDDAERDRVSMLPAGFLLFAGWAALALALPGPIASLLTASAAGVVAVAMVGQRPGGGANGDADSDPDVDVDPAGGGRALGLEVLAIGLAACLAIVVTSALAGEADILGGVPFGVGLADTALAFAVALRLGVIPLHGIAVRLAEGVPRGAAALLLAWGPALFAATALGASQAGVVPLGLPLSSERGLIVGAGVLSIVLGGLVAVVQDDIDRAIVYSIAQDAGFAVIAFAGTDTTVWGPARSWLLILALTKTAFIAWASTIASAFGTRSLDELRGWARRAPLLAATLIVVALATIGLPGMAGFEVRVGLLSAVLSDPVRLVIWVVSFCGLLLYGRLLLVGFAHPSAPVAARGDRPRRSPAPIPTALAGALAALALLFGAGLFDLRSAAALDVPPPVPGQLGQPVGPTFRPVPTEPTPTPSPSGLAPSDSTAPSPAAS